MSWPSTRSRPLGGYFDVIVTGDDTERHKPDPEPLLARAHQLGASSSGGLCRRLAVRHQGGEGGRDGSVAVGWGGIHRPERLEAERPDVVRRQPEELLDVL